MVVFDIGEVLATPVNLYQELAEALGSDPDAVRDAYWTGRDAHDRGSSLHDYWPGVARLVGVEDQDGALAQRLADIDSATWAAVREDAVSVIRDLKARAVKIGLLSNAPFPMAEAVRASEWARDVEAFFFSAELGMAKPDPEIYVAVTEGMQIAPSQVVFFDDRQVNVDAAIEAGWDAYLWTSGARTRAVLEEIGIL
ncbi:haloacid dehalogenase [Arthrobacter sp. StoSoilB5]|nr:haloacid dehalogenase [Arthrobacter sp. StoSoilB5]